MRKSLKFRQYDTRTKEMEYGQGLVKDRMGDHGEGEVFYTMQATGRKDKNGVDIYEHDKVLTYGIEKPRIIVWDEYHAGFIFKDEVFSPLGIVGDTEKVCEVVGSIYENPELLK